MSKSNQKIADLGRAIEPHPGASNSTGGGCVARTATDLRRLLKVGGGFAGIMPRANVGAEPTTEEGLRLIRAFRQVTDPHQRKRLIDQAEAMAKRC